MVRKSSLLAGGSEVLRSIQVAKQPNGESSTLQLFFFDNRGPYRGEKGVNLKLPVAERLLGVVSEGRPINGAQGLKSFGGARDRDGCDGGFCTLNDVFEQTSTDKGDIDRKDKVQIFLRGPECAMNSCQRSTSAKEVFNGGSKGRILLMLADDADVIGKGTR